MKRFLVLGLLLVVALLVAACGRKATSDDCQLIVDRAVELKMKELNLDDPAAIAKRQAQLRGELEGQMRDCVGRRVTDKMMGCVRSAPTSGDLEQCVK
jgi:hypothetical protein